MSYGIRSISSMAAVVVALTSLSDVSAQKREPESGNQTRPGFMLQDIDYERQSASVFDSATEKKETIGQGEKVESWTLMAVVRTDGKDLAVFENLGNRKGSIVFLTKEGVVLSLPKSLERTSVPAETLYRGRTLDEIVQSKNDILAEEILREPGDPGFTNVAACLPPLRIPTFVGTRT